MKIALIANQGGSGGLIAYLNGILSVRTDNEIRIYCTEKLCLSSTADNVSIIRTKAANERGKEILLNKKLAPQLIQMVCDFNPDVVLFCCGWIRRGLEKYPNIMVLHNQLYVDDHAFWDTVSYKNLISFLGFRRIVRRSMSKADGVVFLSEKSKIETEFRNIKYKNGKVIHFGIPDSDFANCVKVKNTLPVKLLYVSAFSEYKNHETLINAIKILKDNGYDVVLNLVGKYPAYREEMIKKLTLKNGLLDCVNFMGWKTHNEVMNIIDEADIFVYPSEVESTGLGVMEAMARGKAIACSDASCMHEMLKDAGVYFHPKDPKSAAAAIERLICDVSLRESLSQKAYTYSHHYTWENAVNKHIEFFREFIKGDKA